MIQHIQLLFIIWVYSTYLYIYRVYSPVDLRCNHGHTSCCRKMLDTWYSYTCGSHCETLLDHMCTVFYSPPLRDRLGGDWHTHRFLLLLHSSYTLPYSPSNSWLKYTKGFEYHATLGDITTWKKIYLCMHLLLYIYISFPYFFKIQVHVIYQMSLNTCRYPIIFDIWSVVSVLLFQIC